MPKKEKHHNEKDSDEKHEVEITNETEEIESKSSHINLWIIPVVVLIIILGFSVVTGGFGYTGGIAIGDGKTAGDNMITSMNTVFDAQERGDSATLITIRPAGLYEANVSIGDSDAIFYTDANGEMIYPAAYGVNLTELVEEAGGSTTVEPGINPAKSDKPEVELFVMAFCPYGVQAENAMKPVAELLGNKADIKVKFIVNVGGNTTNSVQSLHGAPEAMEDLRQVCIRENYDSTVFWKYVGQINTNCYPIYSNATVMDVCWKAAANTAGVNVPLIESCVNISSVEMIYMDELDSDYYGVSGSPSLVLNGVVDGTVACTSDTDCIAGQSCVQYSNGKVCITSRTSDAMKNAICDLFTTPPAECEQALDSSSTAAAGNC
ncbi:MAG: hypothetical protein ABIA21_00845 [Candidatus Aenigmatarchaeota archaeon]